jgi:hypothetical protein
MKSITLLGILLLVLFAPFIQGQDVCPHTGGWEKSGENSQHVTIIINEDKIMFIPDAGWWITEICFKAGTDVYYRSVGSTSEIIVAISPNGKNISHGAALMGQEQDPTSTPTETFTQTPTSTESFTQTPEPSETPEETHTPTIIPSETPTPFQGTPTPWPTKPCTVDKCTGTG